MLCTDCGKHKSPEEFPRNRRAQSGRATYCKPCHNARSRASRAKHGGARRYHLRDRYGIEPADFDRLVEQQGGVCPVCEARPAVHVDHDHVTKQVGGILCEMCNGFLGAFRDDPRLLGAAAQYLEAHGR